MKRLKNSCVFATCAVAALATSIVQAEDINWAKTAAVSASSHRDKYGPDKVNDGEIMFNGRTENETH